MQDLKIVMSSRVDPHLKEMLEEEAANEGSTLSSYLEQLLIQREKIVLAESLQAENIQLRETSEASETEHDRLLRDNEKLQQAIKLQK